MFVRIREPPSYSTIHTAHEGIIFRHDARRWGAVVFVLVVRVVDGAALSLTR